MTARTPDPSRYYVAQDGYADDASRRHLPPPGSVHPGMKLRGDHPVVIARFDVWIDAAEDPETAALAQALAAQLAPSSEPLVEPDPVVDGPIPDRGSGLTRGEVLRARREWQQDGPPQPWTRAGVSEATYIRHRRKFGLVPWPKGYLHRLTP